MNGYSYLDQNNSLNNKPFYHLNVYSSILIFQSYIVYDSIYKVFLIIDMVNIFLKSVYLNKFGA